MEIAYSTTVQKELAHQVKKGNYLLFAFILIFLLAILIIYLFYLRIGTIESLVALCNV